MHTHQHMNEFAHRRHILTDPRTCANAQIHMCAHPSPRTQTLTSIFRSCLIKKNTAFGYQFVFQTSRANEESLEATVLYAFRFDSSTTKLLAWRSLKRN